MADNIDMDNGTFFGMDIMTFLRCVESPIMKGDRAEVIPVNGGVKVLAVHRAAAEPDIKRKIKKASP